MILYSVIALIVLSATFTVIGGIIAKKNEKAYSVYKIIAIVITLCFAVFIIIYSKRERDIIDVFDKTSLYLLTAILTLLIVVPSVLIDKDNTPYNSKTLAFAGISLGLAFILSYVKLGQFFYGGSITLASMLPIMLFAYKYGAKKGITIGFIYGLLQFLQDPVIYEPCQFLLDFPIAFGALGVVGLFSGKAEDDKIARKFLPLTVIAGTLRYLAHVVSGICVFGVYGNDYGFSAVAWGFLYNLYVYADLIIAVGVGFLLLKSKNFVNYFFK